MGMRALVAVPF